MLILPPTPGAHNNKHRNKKSPKKNVTAINFSEEGIRKLNKVAKKEKLKIMAYVSDTKLYLQNCEKSDAIFTINVLQFISETLYEIA